MRCTLSAAAACRPLALAASKSPFVRKPFTATNISRLGMALTGLVRVRIRVRVRVRARARAGVGVRVARGAGPA